jgi:hypothetical protein
MSKPSVARQPRPKEATPDPARPLTLADVTVTWKNGDKERSITGRQLAHLIAAATERTPADDALGHQSYATGRWSYKLRGLSYLIFPDPGVSIYVDDARAFVSDVLEEVAADILADELDSDHRAAHYRVEVRT